MTLLSLIVHSSSSKRPHKDKGTVPDIESKDANISKAHQKRINYCTQTNNLKIENEFIK